eukprot:scaffold2768_cov314-Prasinococcus_capsulatus_cf.AAC.15
MNARPAPPLTCASVRAGGGPFSAAAADVSAAAPITLTPRGRDARAPRWREMMRILADCASPFRGLGWRPRRSWRGRKRGSGWGEGHPALLGRVRKGE